MANPNTLEGQLENNQITYAEYVQHIVRRREARGHTGTESQAKVERAFAEDQKLIELRSRKTHVLARLKAENKLKPKTMTFRGS